MHFILKIQIISGDNDNLDGFFREAIGPFLIVGQFFGVLPVIGVTNRFIYNLKFEWKALRTLYSWFVVTILIIYTLYLTWWTFNTEKSYSTIG